MHTFPACTQYHTGNLSKSEWQHCNSKSCNQHSIKCQTCYSHLCCPYGQTVAYIFHKWIYSQSTAKHTRNSVGLPNSLICAICNATMDKLNAVCYICFLTATERINLNRKYTNENFPTYKVYKNKFQLNQNSSQCSKAYIKRWKVYKVLGENEELFVVVDLNTWNYFQNSIM